MTLARRALSVLWPLVLLLVFLGTFRRTEDGVATPRDPLDSTDVQKLTDLGDRYGAGGQRERAEAAYRRALDVDPRDGDIHVRLGELLWQRGGRAGAHAEAEAALRWHPGSARALVLAARSAPPPSSVNEQ